MSSYASSSGSRQTATSTVSSSRVSSSILHLLLLELASKLNGMVIDLSNSCNQPAAHTSHLESVITRLLVQTKQLLEGLAKWSRGEISEDAISQM